MPFDNFKESYDTFTNLLQVTHKKDLEADRKLDEAKKIMTEVVRLKQEIAEWLELGRTLNEKGSKIFDDIDKTQRSLDASAKPRDLLTPSDHSGSHFTGELREILISLFSNSTDLFLVNEISSL